MASTRETAPPLPLPPVVAAKLRPPPVRPGFIDRAALVDRLREGRDRKLTLVTAPAGYGKSTLLAQWVDADRERTPFVWLALETSDSDPTRLWAHLIAGVHDVYPPAGGTSFAALLGGPRVIADTVIPTFVNELADAPPLVVILDDWHLLRSPLCDATVGIFVEHAPPALQLVISTRADPGLPIARLRAHGQLAEVREVALRLSDAEAVELFERAAVDLSERDVVRVNDRAEGWLAGLALTLLVVKEHADRARFVEEFSGDNRHVLDFLAEDVLAATRPELRHFLLRTSVLGRLSADLCDSVLETTTSAATLAEVAHENLFLIPLDEIGVEYRYHHLFAAMLERELQASDPTTVPALHLRASAWFEAHGDIEAAIEHAIASGDLPRSVDLVVRHSPAYWTSGRLLTVARWLEALAWPEALADPQLALARAQIAGLSGADRVEIERWLAVAESAPDIGSLANGLASLRSAIAIIRSAYLTRGLEAAETSSRVALELEAPTSPWRRQALITLGQALYLLGRPDEAQPPLEEARALPGAHAWAPGAALGLSYLALISIDRGARDDAERISRSAVALVEEHHVGNGLAGVNPQLSLGRALAEGSDVHAAVEHLERAVELCGPTGPLYWRAHTLIRLASALHRLGESRQAAQRLAQARSDLDVLPDTGMLDGLYKRTNVLLSGKARRDGFLGDELSDAEERVLALLAAGRSISQVAHELWLSANTVKTHRRSIYRKLGVSTREQLMERSAALGLAGHEAVDGHQA